MPTHEDHGGRAGKYNKEYKTWKGMFARCYDPTQVGYHRYGGRGIKVCPEWTGTGGFTRFLEHIGPCPSPKLSVDRINNDDDYKIGNVRWATDAEQNSNRSNNHKLTYNGETLTVMEWARRTGLNEQTLHERIRREWSIEDVLTAPLGTRKNNFIKITHAGETLTFSEWADKLKVPLSLIRSRYYRDLSVGEILAPRKPRSEVMRATKSNVMLTHDGKTMCVTDWALHLGISRKTLDKRLLMGWTLERALSASVSASHSKNSNARKPK